MGVPVFKLQLVYPDGSPITFSAGGPIERFIIADMRESLRVALIDALHDAVLEKGVGVFKTEKQVSRAVTASLNEVLLPTIDKALTETFMGLKRESIHLI